MQKTKGSAEPAPIQLATHTLTEQGKRQFWTTAMIMFAKNITCFAI